MREYPVGSVCVICGIDSGRWAPFNSKECTIIVGLKLWHDGEISYEIEVQGEAKTYRVHHENLRLKKLPPDEAFDKFLNNLKQSAEETA
jgi:endogenous inhibitor of DNA gyrase (YacG/DUF329 family)